MSRYWGVDEAWTAAESSPELERELRQKLADEVAIDFPSMRGPIVRMRAAFGDTVDVTPLVAHVRLSFLLSGYEGLKECEKTIPQSSLNALPRSLDRLIELYKTTDQPDELAKWQTERVKYSNN